MMSSGDPSMGSLVHQAARLFRRMADRRLQPLGLSAGHLPVLTALMGTEPLSQKALTEHAGIEQPTMAATLARMERDLIIERRPDPRDGRISLFFLAPATRAKVAAVRAVIEGMNVDSLAALPGEDRARFRGMLMRVIASLGGEETDVEAKGGEAGIGGGASRAGLCSDPSRAGDGSV